MGVLSTLSDYDRLWNRIKISGIKGYVLHEHRLYETRAFGAPRRMTNTFLPIRDKSNKEK